jgi:Ca2+-binding RTX toxin-like protein
MASPQKYIGYGSWMASKAKDASDAMEAYELTGDSSKLNEALTKWSEIVAGAAIGVILEKGMTKKGLGRVFDSMRSNSSRFDKYLKDNKTYQQYLDGEVAKKNATGLLVGVLLDFSLNLSRDFVNEYGLLDPVFEKYDDLLDLINEYGALDPIFKGFDNAYDFISNLIGNDKDPSGSFSNAESKASPIVIDINNNGVVDTLSVADGIHFDIDNNGIAESTGWIAEGDAFLVRDNNGDSVITNGSELFGNHSILSDGSYADNGYEALQEFDSNGDGIVDSSEADAADIEIWQDLNGDGQSQESELLSFSEAGLASISTLYEDTNIDDGYGNTIEQTSQATTIDGHNIDTADVWFDVNLTDTVNLNTAELSEEVSALPDARAFGNVKSLQQAMMTDDALKGYVEQFISATTEYERQSSLRDLIYQWTGATDTDPNSRDEYGSVYMDARKVVALEALVGRGYDSGQGGNFVQGPQAAGILNVEFDRFESYVYSQLMAQTVYKTVFSDIGYVFNTESLEFDYDLTTFADSLQQMVLDNQGEEVVAIIKVLRGLDNYSSPLQSAIESLSSDSILLDYLDLAITVGTAGSDVIEGTSGSDVINAQAGDDKIYGGGGNDVYHYKENDGSNFIYDSSGTDKISFGEGITLDRLILSRDSTTLYIDIQNPDGSVGDNRIQIDRTFDFGGNIIASAIETFRFFDGSELTIRELIGEKLIQPVSDEDDSVYGAEVDETIDGLAGDDFIFGGAGDDTLIGSEGEDTLQGAAGADLLTGGIGDDILQGGEGNDQLTGGSGADTLAGGEGSDTYYFGTGHGQDTVNNYDADGGFDRILFDAGILAENVQADRIGDDLVLSTSDTDSITVERYFNETLDSRYLIDEIVFDDGSVWTPEIVAQKVLTPTEGNDSLSGFVTDDQIHGAGGNDALVGLEGDDSLYGEIGDDTLKGSQGNDYLSGGEGKDKLYGGLDDDTLEGNNGDDYLSGGAGNDQFYGGQGNDHMVGGQGNDLYYFAQGDGEDHIVDKQGELAIYVTNLDPDQAVFRRQGTDLTITFAGNAEQDAIYIDDWFDPVSAFAFSGFSIGRINEVATFFSAFEVETASMAATEFDDALHGNAAGNLIEGLAGNDEITGLSGDDSLNGGEGDDLLEGGSGNDQLSGGTGADTLNGGLGNDTFLFSRGDGADVVIDVSGEDSIEFTDIASTELRVRRVGDDLLLFIPGSDDWLTIQNQYDGSDSAAVASSIEEVRFSDGVVWSFADLVAQAVVGSDLDDEINGFDTDEVIHAQDGSDVVYAAAGADTVSGGAGNDALYGGQGDDQLNGDAGDDQLYGEQGEDLLSGGEGADLLQGGSDTDQLFGDTGNDALYGGEGDDQLFGGQDDDTLYGGSGNDQLYGEDGNDLLYAEGGNDNWLSGGDGNDQLYGVGQLSGDAGNDYLEGQGTLSGGDGNDQLYGQGSDTLLGGAGEDTLVAYSDPWALTANTLAGGTGADTLYGSYGDDTYLFSLGDGQDTLIETHIDGAFSNIDPSTDTLVFGAGIVATDLSFIRHGDDLSIEHSNGTDSILVKKWFAEPTDHFKINRFLFDDGSELSDLEIEEASVTQGTTSDDTLLGYRDLNEEIHAGDGNDQVWGRTGDDLIYGEAGDDYLDGEEGNDHLIGGEGADNLVGRAGDDTLEGDAGEDSLQGGEGADHLYGGADDDSLFGGSGDDLLDGGSGADYFDAGAGNDTLLGGDGSDQLSGGIGNDQLSGGAGDDKYVYFGGDGHDVIDTSDGGNDGVFFGSGISEDRLHFTRAGDDLLILIDDGSEGSVRVLNHFQGGESAIDWVQPDGGYMINTTQIDQRVSAGETGGDYDAVISGTDSGEQLAGSSGSDLIQGLAGNDTLFGMTGDDRIEGGNGSDQLYGGNGSGSGSGNDQLIGGAGNDILAGEDGNDELQGGEGDDRYYYSAGQGVDTIDNTGGGSDGIFFLDGLDRSRLSYHQDGDDLVILVDGDLEQQVRVINHFLGGDYSISYVQPTDGGYSIMASEIASMLTDLPTAEVPEDGEGGDGSEPGNDAGGETGTGEDPVAELGGDDIINGTASADILVGGAGNDTLIGNGGDDRLLGGKGDDTYIFTSGEVTLSDSSGTDTLLFSAGITFNQVASGLMKSGNDLILQVEGGASGQVTLKDYFVDGNAIIETIEFESGGSLTSDQIFGAFGLSAPGGSTGYDQFIEGTVGDDSTLSGTSGSDLISGFNGNDQLAGSEGDDLLSGGNGDDTLSGNEGSDTLLGGRGNDTYLFYSGDGEDTIDNTGGGIDVLRFEDIDFGQVSSGLMRSGDDLILRVSGSSDAVTLKSFFLGGDAAIDRVEFASGGEITSDQFFSVFGLNNPDSVGSPDYQGVPDERNFGTQVSGTADGDTIIASSDADLIDGGAGDDWLQGNQGNDYLMGGEGSDTYYYSTGDGQDSINNQSSGGDADTLQFADGIDESDLWFSRDGDDLLADFRNSSDQVRVQGWYSGSTQQLDSIQTDDAVISATQIEQLVSAMAAFGAPVDGEIVLTAAEEQQVQATIANTWQVRT